MHAMLFWLLGIYISSFVQTPKHLKLEGQMGLKVSVLHTFLVYNSQHEGISAVYSVVLSFGLSSVETFSTSNGIVEQ